MAFIYEFWNILNEFDGKAMFLIVQKCSLGVLFFREPLSCNFKYVITFPVFSAVAFFPNVDPHPTQLNEIMLAMF